MSHDAGGFSNTRDAVAYLGLSPGTLDGYRVSGEGPAFHRFGSRTHYARPELDAWAAKRRECRTAGAERLTAA